MKVQAKTSKEQTILKEVFFLSVLVQQLFFCKYKCLLFLLHFFIKTYGKLITKKYGSNSEPFSSPSQGFCHFVTLKRIPTYELK